MNDTFDREMSDWNKQMEAKWRRCVQLGIHDYGSIKANTNSPGSTTSTTARCMPVYYELLVQEPEKWMRRVYEYVGLPFNSDVLRHQDFIKNRIRLSRRACFVDISYLSWNTHTSVK